MTEPAMMVSLRGSPLRVPSSERAYAFILILYVFGISAFHRDFARLHVTVAGIPFFVGELTVTMLIALLLPQLLRKGRFPIGLGFSQVALIIYLFIGATYVLRGLLQGYGIAALRDSALVYYAIFFFFTLIYIHSNGKPVHLIRAIVLGAIIGSTVTSVRFLFNPSLTWEHGAPGYQALLAWLAVVYLLLSLPAVSKARTRALYFISVLICSFVVYLSAYKTMLGVMLVSVVSLGAWAILGGRLKGRWNSRSALLATSVLVIMTVAVISHALALTPSKDPLPVNGPVALGDGFNVLSSRWVQGYLSLQATLGNPTAATEGSLSFRFTVWRKAIARIQSSPIIGIGFGPPPSLYPDEHCELRTSDTSNCGNAHNTFLTLAMRMGIPTFLFFFGINVYIVGRFMLRRWADRKEPTNDPLNMFLFVAYVSFMVFAFMSLFFESPYLSSLYWVVLAIIYQRAGPIIESESQARSRPV